MELGIIQRYILKTLITQSAVKLNSPPKFLSLLDPQDSCNFFIELNLQQMMLGGDHTIFLL